MKKSLKCLLAATASVVSTTAFAASNVENPLYMPKAHEAYAKIGAALMIKKVESTEATRTKHTDGSIESPVWRFTGDLGYGITDRLDIHGRFGYTNDVPVDRKGMHRGRIGMTFRALTEESPIVWDLYADAYLSGVSKMKGEYTTTGFKYENYSNGRWGAIVGTRFGKTFDKLTLAGHVEYLQTFGNHNNRIIISHPGLLAVGFPNEIAVDLKSTSEWTAGVDTMYQITDSWSLGAGFEFVQHADNGVKGINSQLKTLPAPYDGYQQNAVAQLLAQTADMNDGWDEYTIKANVAYQMTDYFQLVPFVEYTFDKGHSQSQNATDYKVEFGARLNARF